MSILVSAGAGRMGPAATRERDEMTDRRDLKKRIRARQEKTGERYTTARAHVMGSGTDRDLVVELRDISEAARAAGFVCRARATPAVPETIEARALAQLREILLGPVAGLEPLRKIALHGGPQPGLDLSRVLELVNQRRAFHASLELGLRGPGPGGRIVAFDLLTDGECRTIVAQLLPTRSDALLLLSGFPNDPVVADSINLWERLRLPVGGNR
jgi:hypothetical protein